MLSRNCSGGFCEMTWYELNSHIVHISYLWWSQYLNRKECCMETFRHTRDKSICLGQRWSVQPRRPDQLGNRLWEKVFGSNNFNETAAVNQFDLIFAETALECTQGYQNIEHGSITSWDPGETISVILCFCGVSSSTKSLQVLNLIFKIVLNLYYIQWKRMWLMLFWKCC